MTADRQGEAGFTLLEVLIALVILAIGATGLIGAVRQDLRQQAGLEDKSIALWVAQNRMAELHAAHQGPNDGATHETTAMAGRDWALTITAAPTASADLKALTIDVVRTGATASSSGASLTGFMGRH